MQNSEIRVKIPYVYLRLLINPGIVGNYKGNNSSNELNNIADPFKMETEEKVKTTSKDISLDPLGHVSEPFMNIFNKRVCDSD